MKKIVTQPSPKTAKSSVVNKLIEALMVKTGIKSGPEFTCCN